MGTKRLTRVNELLKREVASVLYRVMNERDFDVATVTVTHVVSSPDLRHARVLVSVRGDPAHQQHTIGLIRRHRKTIQQIVNRDVALKYTPRLIFELDDSIAAGDRVLGILHELEMEEAEDAPMGEPPEETTEP
jgi:ribosome-binding factor A